MDQSKDDQPAEGGEELRRRPSDGEDTSDASSPEPGAPLQPLFSVRFTDEVTKDGDGVCYRMQVTRVRDTRRRRPHDERHS